MYSRNLIGLASKYERNPQIYTTRNNEFILLKIRINPNDGFCL